MCSHPLFLGLITLAVPSSALCLEKDYLMDARPLRLTVTRISVHCPS